MLAYLRKQWQKFRGPKESVATEDKSRPDRIAESADEIAEVFARKEQDHILEAQRYAYGKEVMQTIATNFRGRPDHPTFAGAERALNKFGLFVATREAEARTAGYNVTSEAWALGTSVTANVSLASEMVLPTPSTPITWTVRMPNPPPDWEEGRVERYARRLDTIRAGLGDTFRAVRTHLFGLAEDSERIALFQMRQTYDVLMRSLAPDDEVRASPYFTQKDGDKPMQIYRAERLRFAANKHVKDPIRRVLIESEVENILSLYKKLNELHGDAPVRNEVAQPLILAMRAVIENWLDAVEN